ncbi:MAG TPA: hypothetical protein VFN10_20780 [Thermoanaerobaculia bacterium]|nr:hypothetical protein [Thermoanaerobaculia bacterium]
MRRLTISLLLLLAACTTRPPEVMHAEKQRGMSYACAFDRNRDIRYGSPASAESLRELKRLGVTWISITPFGFTNAANGGSLRWSATGTWESDDTLFAVTKQAHALGMHVLMKPHIWLRNREAVEKWSDADHRKFVEDYAGFLDHYATVARDAGADALSIGNEVRFSTTRDEQAWRAMIAATRKVFRGPLTYGANFDEVFDVPFWDALDWIGVSAYFPLVDAPSPDRAALVKAWQPIVAKLAALSERHRKPVLFTELGYRSAQYAAWRQWEIPRDAPPDAAAQRSAYEAFFEAVWPQPWLLGVYPWKWFSYPNHGNPDGNDYDVEHKPAEEAIRAGYIAPARPGS